MGNCKHCGKELHQGLKQHEAHCKVSKPEIIVSKPDEIIEPDKLIEKVKEKVKEITKVEDDKIDDSAATIAETSPDVDDSPRQDSSIFIVILIIIALVAGICIFFADEIKGIFGNE